MQTTKQKEAKRIYYQKNKEHIKARVKAQRLSKIEYYRAYDRKRNHSEERRERDRLRSCENISEARKAQRKCSVKNWEDLNRDIKHLHYETSVAIKNGSLIKPARCELCKVETSKLKAYQKGNMDCMDVEFLCSKCLGVRKRKNED